MYERDHHEDEQVRTSGRHLRFGWWLLFVFLLVGAGLEAMHGFKVGLYLDASNETRRLLWRLGHAHGTLLSIVNIAFAVSLPFLPTLAGGRLRAASTSLLLATVLLPLGFLLGGANAEGGDPGLGILLVPLGALALATAVLLTALSTGTRAARRRPRSTTRQTETGRGREPRAAT